MKVFSCHVGLLSGLFLVGCQSSPGIEVGWSFKLPPTVRQTVVHNPLPATVSTVYVQEAATPAPIMQRQFQVQPGQVAPAPAPVPINPVVPQPVRQLLPMPRESSPGCAQPCQPAAGE